MISYELDLSRRWIVELEEKTPDLVTFCVICSPEDSIYMVGDVRRDGCFNTHAHEDDFFHGCGPEDTFLTMIVYELAMGLMEEKVEYDLGLLARGDFIREVNLV